MVIGRIVFGLVFGSDIKAAVAGGTTLGRRISPAALIIAGPPLLKEHLDFFAAFEAVSLKTGAAAGTEALRRVILMDQRHARAALKIYLKQESHNPPLMKLP